MSGTKTTSELPDGLDTMLVRTQAAAVLTASGFPVSGPTLATMATRGGGPPFHKWGTRAVYRWGDCLEWAQGRLGRKRRSTSEGDVQGGGMPGGTGATHAGW